VLDVVEFTINNIDMKFLLSAIFFLFFSTFALFAQERPFIWVQKQDREQILNKIEHESWAKSYFDLLITSLDKGISTHQADPEKFLRGLPFDWKNAKVGETPPFFYTTHIVNGKHFNLDNATEEELANSKQLIAYLQIAMDCGIAYYLTEDEKYAQCALDIFNASIKGIVQLEPSDWKFRGGWIFPDDILAESRKIGDKLPIIYDFIAPYIQKGGKPYDLGEKSKIDFPWDVSQQVFRTYADLIVTLGMIGSNHPVLEAPCLVYSALALESEKERNKYLKYYLTESTDNQDALSKVAEFYEEDGAV
jgi:hypothetical protein